MEWQLLQADELTPDGQDVFDAYRIDRDSQRTDHRKVVVIDVAEYETLRAEMHRERVALEEIVQWTQWSASAENVCRIAKAALAPVPQAA